MFSVLNITRITRVLDERRNFATVYYYYYFTFKITAIDIRASGLFSRRLQKTKKKNTEKN